MATDDEWGGVARAKIGWRPLPFGGTRRTEGESEGGLMNTKTQKNCGFTLIELLIVVVIIGILASIAIPKFASVRERSYMATVILDLNQVER